jgi:hypothetical protein
MMAESEIYMHKRNIKNITEKLQELEIENQKNEEKITQVKTENKVLYSTEYDLIHKILHYEKKLSEMSNMKQRNMIILNQTKSDLGRVESNLNGFIGVRDRILNSNLRRKEYLEREISRLNSIDSEALCLSDNLARPMLNEINSDVVNAFIDTYDNLRNNLTLVMYEKNNQLSINYEKKSEMIDRLRDCVTELDIRVEELEYPEELIKRLYSMISAINSKNNYYDLVEREENTKQLAEGKLKLKELKRSIYDKLKSNRIKKFKRW